jgi:hypothetical protein
MRGAGSTGRNDQCAMATHEQRCSMFVMNSQPNTEGLVGRLDEG